MNGAHVQRVRLTSTDAIPLKRMDFGEADRIITIITPGRGRIRVTGEDRAMEREQCGRTASAPV